MFVRGRALSLVAVLGCCLAWAAPGFAAAPAVSATLTAPAVSGETNAVPRAPAIPGALAARVTLPDFAGEHPSDDVNFAAGWVMAEGDNQGMPFAIVDKREARLYVFGANGRLAGATPTLLGLALGDRSVPGIAQRTPASLRPAERTTPAGRFLSQPGHNDKGEAIVWVDYEASIAIHRLRPAPPAERRRERLASGSPADKRITLGCVVVPVAFFENVVTTVLGQQRGVVYVLPENRSVREAFNPVLQLGLR